MKNKFRFTSVKQSVTIFLFICLSFGASSAQKAEVLYSDSVTVYIFLLNECVICDYNMPGLKDLHEEFTNTQIQFVGLFPNFSSSKKDIAEFEEKHGVPFKLKTDYFKKQCSRFGVKIMPEVVVFDEKNEVVLYQGRIDNTYAALGKRRKKPSKTELKDALKSISLNQPIEVVSAPAVGCFINFSDQIH